MSEPPTSDQGRQERPRPGAPQPLRSVSPWASVGGAVLAFVGTWLLFAIAVMALYSAYGDSTSTEQTVMGVAALLALPLLGLALMIAPLTRHAGAGLLMGIAIGSVVGAGICGTVIGGTMQTPRRRLVTGRGSRTHKRDAALHLRRRTVLAALLWFHRRLQAYPEVGGDCLDAPRIDDLEHVSASVTAVSPRPANPLINAPFTAVTEAAQLGVRQVSETARSVESPGTGSSRPPRRSPRPVRSPGSRRLHDVEARLG